MKRRKGLKGALLGVVMVVAGLGLVIPQAMAEAPTAIKVGSVIALTGRMAAGGKDVKAGYDLAVKHINDAGGVMVQAYGKNFLWI
jgi:ABC-type branched-subunit amino acid transport system substrate-binding protein